MSLPGGDNIIKSVGHLYSLELEEEDLVKIPEKSSSELTTKETCDKTYSCIPIEAVVSDICQSGEPNNDDVIEYYTRPKRASAVIARDLVKKWTQLINLIF